MKKQKGKKGKSGSSSKGKALKRGASKANVAVKSSAPILPLADRVLLKPLSADEMATRTVSGIIIPDTVTKEKPEQGIVVAVGPGKVGDDNVVIPVSVSVGDRVVFSKYGYDEVKVGGVEYYLVSESNILAVINGK